MPFSRMIIVLIKHERGHGATTDEDRLIISRLRFDGPRSSPNSRSSIIRDQQEGNTAWLRCFHGFSHCLGAVGNFQALARTPVHAQLALNDHDL